MFADMKACNVASTMYSVSGALRAAAEVAALEQCRIIHAHAVVTGFDMNVIVGSALVDGYGKAGFVLDARQVFDENLLGMNIVGWNALMSGYAQQGDKNSTLELFNSMEARGLVPDEYSFLAVLMSFCNANLAVETEQWLTRMKEMSLCNAAQGRKNACPLNVTGTRCCDERCCPILHGKKNYIQLGKRMMLLVKIEKQAMKQGHYLLRLKCRYLCHHQWQAKSSRYLQHWLTLISSVVSLDIHHDQMVLTIDSIRLKLTEILHKQKDLIKTSYHFISHSSLSMCVWD
nr:pentatricopeptide repeat-containing protein [Quercus suber]